MARWAEEGAESPPEAARGTDPKHPAQKSPGLGVLLPSFVLWSSS